MQRKNWVLGAATGLILVGSLLGVGCKKSNNNASATKTAQSNATKTALSKVTPAKSPTANAATAAKTPAAPGASATVIITQNATAGAILTDASGKALYKYASDQANVSNCTATCAQNWPPLTVASGTTPTAGTGVTGQLGTIQRADGTTQVTLNGSPLYYFASDIAAGDAKGDGVGGFSLIKTGG